MMETEKKEDDLDFDTNDKDDFSDIESDFNYDDNLNTDVGGGAPPLEKHNDLLKDLTNFDPYLKATFNNWLGLSWNEEKQKFVKNPLISQVMSLNCATWCTGMQKTYARNNNIITDIGSEEYRNMISDMIDAIWLNLGTREDFEIFEDGDLLRVANELQHSSELALMGAGDGKYTKFLGTTISRNESVTSNGQSQSQEQMMRRESKPKTMDKVRKVFLGE